MLKGHLPRVIYHRVNFNVRRVPQDLVEDAEVRRGGLGACLHRVDPAHLATFAETVKILHFWEISNPVSKIRPYPSLVQKRHNYPTAFVQPTTMLNLRAKVEIFHLTAFGQPVKMLHLDETGETIRCLRQLVTTFRCVR